MKIVTVEAIWSKDIECPVCGSNFTAYNVRRTAVSVSKKDPDFCCHYEGINPLYYMIWVCPLCRYAALRRDEFTNVKDTERGIILEAGDKLRAVAGDRVFDGERDLETALEAFKLAVECYTIRNANLSKMAGLYLNMAWLCRTKEGGGLEEQEKEYTQKTLDFYNDALQNQAGGFGEMGEIGIQYLVGELNYNLGNHKDAIQCYAAVIYSNEKDFRPDIVNMARERWQDVKEEWNKIKKERGEPIDDNDEPAKPVKEEPGDAS